MLRVHRAVDGEIGQAAGGGQLLGRAEAPLRRDAVGLGGEVAAEIVRLGNGDDAQLLRVEVRVRGVEDRAVPGTNDGSGERSGRHGYLRVRVGYRRHDTGRAGPGQVGAGGGCPTCGMAQPATMRLFF